MEEKSDPDIVDYGNRQFVREFEAENNYWRKSYQDGKILWKYRDPTPNYISYKTEPFKFNERQWSSNPHRQINYNVVDDRECTYGDVNTMGFKLFHGTIDPIVTRSNFKAQRKLFSDMAVELLCNHNLELQFLLNYPGVMDEPVRYSNDKQVTPDFVFTINDRTTAFEFKSNLIGLSGPARTDEYLRVRDKYKFDTIIVFQVLDERYPSSIGMTLTEKRIFGDFRDRLINVINSDKLLYKQENESSLRTMPPFKSWMAKVFPHKNDRFDVKKFRDLDWYLDRVFEAVTSKRLENFLNNNFWESKDLVSGIQYNTPDISSVHYSHPFSRDSNKEHYNTEIGRKAKNILSFPIYLGVQMGDLKTGSQVKILIKTLTKRYGINYVALLDIVEMTEYKDMIENFQKINSEIALLHTVDTKQMADDHAVESNRKHIYRLRQLKKDMAIDVSKLVETRHPGYRIKKTGLIKAPIKDGEFISKVGVDMKFKDKEQYAKDRESNIEMNIDDLENYWDINDILQFEPDFPDVFDNSLDFSNLYENNPSVNSFANEINHESRLNMEKILKSPLYKFGRAMSIFYKDLITAIPTDSVKNGGSNQFTIVKHHVFSAQTIMSVNPNNISSGICITIFRANRLPPDFMIECFKIEGFNVFVTKPYRFNYQMALNYDQYFIGGLSTALLMNHYSVDLTSNALFISLFLNYTRELNKTFVLIYYAYQMALAKGNFGRIEAVPKISGFRITDFRACIMLTRLKAGFVKMQEEIDYCFENDIPINTKDPIFGFMHTDIQTFLTIAYLKLMPPRNDGIDSDFLLGKSFMDELDHQSLWEKCVSFNKDNIPDDPVEFFKSIVHDDETTWDQASYHPGTAYRVFEELMKEANLSGCKMSNGKSFVQGLIETSKPKRFNVAKSNDDSRTQKPKFDPKIPLPDVPPLLKEADLYATGYKTLKSVSQKERCHVTVIEFREFLDRINGIKEDSIDGRNSERMFFDLCKDMDIKPDLRDSEFSIMEAVLFLKDRYPEKSILTMAVKDQKDYDQRCFFIQNEFWRHANKVFDESYRFVLEKNKEDIILVSGDQKYKKLEKTFNRAGHHTYDHLLTITEDQNKFGDLYPMEVFSLINLVAKELNEIDQIYYDFFEFCIDGAIGRFILAPHKFSRNIEELRRKRSDYKRKHGKFIASDLTEKLLAFMDKFLLDSGELFFSTFSDLSMQNTDIPVIKDVCIRKMVGFTLGVLNILGSIGTAGHCRTINLVLNRLGLPDLTESVSHSDDSLTACHTHTPDMKIFKQRYLGQLRNLYNDGYRLSGNPSEGFFAVHDEYPRVKIEEDVITKLIVSLAIFCPRIFGQKCSLRKYKLGDSGEVLQVVIIKGRVHVPLSRATFSMGADSDSGSPASELLFAVGKLNILLSHGNSMQLVNDQIHMMNWMTYYKFRINPNDVRPQLPLELWGVWYAVPSSIFQFGFAANRVRMLSNTMVNENLRNTYIMMLHEEGNWKQRVENLSTTHMPTVLKDFKITYGRNFRTSFAFIKLYNQLKDNIDRIYRHLPDKPKPQLETPKTHRETEKVRRVVDSMFSKRITGRLSSTDKNIEFLNHYLSESSQDTFSKLPTAVKYIQILGYQNRQYVLGLRGPEEDSIMTCRSIILYLRECGSSYKHSETSESMYNVLIQLYNKHINHLAMLKMPSFLSKYVPHHDMPKYKVVRDNMYESAFSFHFDGLLSIYYEMTVEKRKYNQSSYLSNNIELYLSEDFELLYGKFQKLIGDLKIPNDKFESYYHSMKNLFKIDAVEFTMKVFSDSEVWYDTILYKTRPGFKMITNSSIQESVIRLGDSSTKIESKTRLLLISEYLIGDPQTIREITCIDSNQVYKLIDDSDLTNMVYNTPNRTSLNYILLYHHAMGTTFQFYRNKESNTYGCRTFSEYYYIVFKYNKTGEDITGCSIYTNVKSWVPIRFYITLALYAMSRISYNKWKSHMKHVDDGDFQEYQPDDIMFQRGRGNLPVYTERITKLDQDSFSRRDYFGFKIGKKRAIVWRVPLNYTNIKLTNKAGENLYLDQPSPLVGETYEIDFSTFCSKLKDFVEYTLTQPKDKKFINTESDYTESNITNTISLILRVLENLDTGLSPWSSNTLPMQKIVDINRLTTIMGVSTHSLIPIGEYLRDDFLTTEELEINEISSVDLYFEGEMSDRMVKAIQSKLTYLYFPHKFSKMMASPCIVIVLQRHSKYNLTGIWYNNHSKQRFSGYKSAGNHKELLNQFLEDWPLLNLRSKKANLSSEYCLCVIDLLLEHRSLKQFFVDLTLSNGLGFGVTDAFIRWYLKQLVKMFDFKYKDLMVNFIENL